MYLLYVDGSGTPDIPGDLHHYAVVGVCMHERQWFAVDKRVRRLKQKYALAGAEPFELHAKDICVDYREQGKIVGFDALTPHERRAAVLAERATKLQSMTGNEAAKKRASYRKTAGLVHLTRSERSRLYEEALDLTGDHQGLRLFGEIIDKRTPIAGSGEAAFSDASGVVRCAFTQMVTRFEAFLKKHHSTTGRHDKGLIVMDNDPTHAERMDAMMRSFRTHGHPWGDIRYVIEAPFFVDSDKAAGVQLADLTAYCTRRYVERASTPNTHEENNFKRLFHQFHREGASLHGVRHYCARNSCRCMICAGRGHGTSVSETIIGESSPATPVAPVIAGPTPTTPVQSDIASLNVDAQAGSLPEVLRAQRS